MKKLKKTILALFIIPLFSWAVHANAGFKRVEIEKLESSQPGSWQGKWYDAQGGYINILEEPGFLNIIIVDKISTTKATCVINEKNIRKAMCFGEGMSHTGTESIRYIYKNTLILNNKDQLLETWNYYSTKNEDEGKAIFNKKMRATR